ncbi:hypothetical protein RN001_001906 [Aquatica leii]|uniref:Uncharacterized protein n=1 Tax=Aquatica leii TaxID=1421715 RepID=A0AAN7QAR0_9COLE|nr:hypothetical protein RN001_001906 [Aquatica leii]
MSLESIRKNPEEFRIFLKELITNVSAVTSTNKNDTQFESECRFIELFIQDRFKDLLTNLINCMWERYDLTTKTMHLNELEKQFPPDYIAWRPSSGTVPIATLKGNQLVTLKNKLELKINNCTKRVNVLNEILFKKLEVLKKPEKEINENQELLLQIQKEYEEIIN